MASISKRGKSWYLHWREKGTQHKKSLGPVSQAEAEIQREAKNHELAITPAAGPLFADWAVKYTQWHSQEYPDSYFRVEQIIRTHLEPTFGTLPLMAISRRHVEDYKHKRAGNAAAATIIKEIRTLQAMMNHAVTWEVIPRNPIIGVKPPKNLSASPPHWYTKEEMSAIYRMEMAIHKCTTTEAEGLHRLYRWTWQLMVNTGMRRGEALHLKWKDVGKEEIRIISTEEQRTKSGKWRIIPIADGAKEALEEVKADKQWVLPQIRPESLSRCFDRTVKRADIGGSIHCLRHTYCSHLVMNGVPLRTVQVLAGHALFRTTERYAHLAPSHLQDAVKGLSI